MLCPPPNCLSCSISPQRKTSQNHLPLADVSNFRSYPLLPVDDL